MLYISSRFIESMDKRITPVAVAGLWIALSEFVRNEFLFRDRWIDHYTSLGLQFKTLPINGFLWMVWSLLLAYILTRLLRRFSFTEAVFIAWLAAFVMMWVTVFNLQVLPLVLLIFAIPLSLLEVAIAGIIIKKLKGERILAS